MSTSPINTIVVLVQENRSFDHMLGWMKTLNPEINGVTGTSGESRPIFLWGHDCFRSDPTGPPLDSPLTGTEFNHISANDPASEKLYFGDKSEHVDPDPGHSIQDIYEQIFGMQWDAATASEAKVPEMKGFAQNAERLTKGMSSTVMNGFQPDSVPIYKELVSEFAVFDRWFASVPASTQPNRLFVHSATSHGAERNDRNKLIAGFPQKTIFESMDEAGHSFGIYYQNPPSTLFYRNLRKLKYLGKFHPFDLDFKKHCEEGTLPNYTVIEQRFFDIKLFPANDDHPSHDVGEGQKFVKHVYETLRASPQWEKMLFIITYDEHGGFYDHVPTPAVGVPSPDGLVGPDPYKFQFDRLGVRVPTIMISPWIERGTVVHGPSGPYPTSEFEHSSIPATVKKIFNLNEFLTKRDAWAGTFESVLSRSTPRTDCPVTLPDPQKIRPREADENVKLSEFQEELVQMAATLNGDCYKDTYPDKLVENMTCAEGCKYVEAAFQKFRENCENARKSGTDDSEIVIPKGQQSREPAMKKSFVNKIISCFGFNS